MNEENTVQEEYGEQEKPVIIEDVTIPTKSPEVTIREEMEEDGKYMLFNAENELILVVNSSGKFILDNCDGEKTVAQLVEEIENNFTISEEMDMTGIVKNYIETLLKAKLIGIEGEEN